MQALYADIILPLAVNSRFTYEVPGNMAHILKPGMRVNVPFGKNRIYIGIVHSVHYNKPIYRNIRLISGLIDNVPVINDFQLKLWSWISEYYMCSEGEVMKASIPAELSLNRFKPRLETFVELSRNYSEEELNTVLDSLKKAPRQQEMMLRYLELADAGKGTGFTSIKKSLLLSGSNTLPGTIDALIKKGILFSFPREVSRLSTDDNRNEPIKLLSEAQSITYTSVQEQFKNKDIVLLHGVTSSGKTEIYIHLIEEKLRQGKQVLYMLPEIALTTQIIERLKRHFGNQTGVYHSRLSDPERVEIWNKLSGADTSGAYKLILGVRSSVFLPFSDLGLVIIDEEHDGSYKQHDPAPRYHGRDTAIMLSSLHGAKTILGSASPSLESYNNAMTGKYGLTQLKVRYGHINLPEIVLANTREAYKRKMMVSHFTPELLNAIDNALGRGEQVILFQNRRGFSPYIECTECGWIPVCVQCAVNLTYHKSIKRLVCHYCGYSTDLPSKCGNCGSSGMATRGFGTEKIEDEIKIVFPSARVARMDQDTTQSRTAFNKLIRAFEEGRTDILIGTQMISKGLDFENLTVVGVLNADNLLHFPDFRSHERSFQMLEQVSGRAGRRSKQGRVVIQTSDPANRIIRLVLRHDYEGMFRMQMEERKAFNYPPFTRMIRINIRHRDRVVLNNFADMIGNELRKLFGKRVLGPESPVISQVQSYYIKTILIKIEREKPPAKAKQLIAQAIEKVEAEKGASALKISVDVDPY
jgi:primosomal protein N' (replication factor Y)